jgi:hypothetical protein
MEARAAGREESPAAITAIRGAPAVREESPAAVRGATAVLAAVRAHAEDAEGRAELYELRSALLMTGGVKATLDRMSPERSLVSVVLARYEPLCLDSHDTVARRALGARWADASFRWARSRGGRSVSLLCWLALALAFPGALFGLLDPYVGIAVLAFIFCDTTFKASVFYIFPLVRLCLLSFNFWYLCANLAMVAAGAYLIFEDRGTGVIVAMVLGTLGPTTVMGDCLVRRSRLSALMYSVSLLLSLTGSGGVFFRLFPGMHEVTIRVLAEPVSVSNLTCSAGIAFAVFLASFIHTSLRYPDRLVILTGLRCVKMRRAAAREICQVYSLQDHLVAIYNARGNAVAPLPQSPRALGDAADVALREAGGDDAAARQLRLRVLDELISEQPLRRCTMEIQGQVLERWRAPGEDEDAFQRVLLPAFVPIVVDPRRTVATALGGAGFSALVYRACRSPLLVGLTVVVLPALYAVFLALFCAREPAAPLIAVAIALQTVALPLNTAQILLLNTELLERVVLRSFDVWFLLGNLYLVGVTGFFLFKDNTRSVMWLIAHLQVSTYFFQDAAPASRRSKRVNALALAGYALSQCFAVVAMWTQLFDTTGHEVHLFGVPVSTKSWCLAGQANVAVLSTRFAVRALWDHRNLTFSLGLIRVRLPEAEAREIKAVMMAERLLHYKPQAPLSSCPEPRTPAAGDDDKIDNS